jgi:hypothetical protein
MPSCGNTHDSQHNPLDAWWQPPDTDTGLSAESEHGTELGKLDAAEWFGEDVGRVFVSGHVGHGDCLLFDLFAYPMVWNWRRE